MSKIKNLSFKQAKHLVERTGLGPELSLIESFVGKPLDSAVSSILEKPLTSHVSAPVVLKPSKLRELRKEYVKNNQKAKFRKIYRKERNALKVWGLKSLLTSDNPLHERMVWFWHNHFTSSVKKVRQTHWMLQQDSLLRSNAMGNFGSLLKSIPFDPAMLIYLDGRSNKKGQPNENFARELLELFTLGEGNYSEQDIKEAARALTGWVVNTKKNKVIFRKKLHDSGTKTFMGKTGNLNAEDIINILLQNPRTAEFIAEKFWHEFVSTQAPEPQVIKVWAKSFIASNYDIKKLLKTVFESDAFWDEKYKGTLIKSPIDLVVGTLRTFDLEDMDIPSKFFLKQLKQMGQDLYEPPNVKGWEGGKAWIDDNSLLRRQRFLGRILRGQTRVNNKNNKGKMVKAMQAQNMSKISDYDLPDLSAQQWSDWLLAIPAITPINKKTKQARLEAILLDPAYQLK